jgi:hypothetical protein
MEQYEVGTSLNEPESFRNLWKLKEFESEALDYRTLKLEVDFIIDLLKLKNSVKATMH